LDENGRTKISKKCPSRTKIPKKYPSRTKIPKKCPRNKIPKKCPTLSSYTCRETNQGPLLIPAS
jgi:hypothetical protein